jgi:hypothetical protein
MLPRDFCYWLQGFFEISDADTMTAEQVEIVKNHLNLVFVHAIDQQYGENRDAMKRVHDGKARDNKLPPGLEAMC